MIKVPEDTIAAIPYDDFYRGRQDEVYFNLRGDNKREWFSRHAYFCLPLVIGNQYGFAMRSLLRATFLWNGGPDPADTTVTFHDTEEVQRLASLQTMVSNFGLGIVTVQAAFALRTSPDISLMTMQPPNYFIDGLQNMTGVVETDNLRRDFTFNLKVTRPNFPIEIAVGDVIAAAAVHLPVRVRTGGHRGPGLRLTAPRAPALTRRRRLQPHLHRRRRRPLVPRLTAR